MKSFYKKRHLKSKSEAKSMFTPFVRCALKRATSISLNLSMLILWSQATAKFVILVAQNLLIIQDLSPKMKNLSEFFRSVSLNEKNSKVDRWKAGVKVYNFYFPEIFYIGKLTRKKINTFFDIWSPKILWNFFSWGNQKLKNGLRIN